MLLKPIKNEIEYDLALDRVDEFGARYNIKRCTRDNRHFNRKI